MFISDYTVLHCSLGYNVLTPTGVKALAIALQYNKSLEELE